MNDNQIQPGQSFTPGQQSQPGAAPPPEQSLPTSPAPAQMPGRTLPASPAPTLPQQPVAPAAPPVSTPNGSNPTSGGQVVASTPHTALEQEREKTNQPKDGQPATELEPEETLFSWNAPEFTFISKPAGWYGILALVSILLAGIALFFRQWMAAVLVLVMGTTLGVVAGRRPRVLNYSITNYGVYVGEKAYPFDNFKAHYEGHDYNQAVLELVPVKRFSPLVSLPVVPQNHDEIFDIIGDVVPKTEPVNSLVDRIFTYLRF